MTLGDLRGDLEPQQKRRQWKKLKQWSKLGQANNNTIYEILTRVQTKAPLNCRRGRDPPSLHDNELKCL